MGIMLMKNIKTLSVALILATSGIIGFTGCAGDRYHESTGEDVDDSATTERVRRALDNDSMYKFPDVKVTTFKGTVQLSGFVDNSDEKSRAHDLAKNVPGARDVVNNISVKQ
jgi:hyperosmotically inducible periplasmic protein